MDPFPPLPSPPLHTSDTTSFPIIAVAVIGILATAFLLVSYYVFVIKCCLNWHRIDFLRRFSTSRSPNHDDPFTAYSPGRMSAVRGLDESVIRSIPIFKYTDKALPYKDFGGECAVCLNEFQEEESLRMIPSCCHVFHIDCIDVWLQNNGNCPLCRTSISGTAPRLFPFDHIVAPSSSPQDPTEEYVVIELGDYTDRTLVSAQERLDPGELPSVASRRKFERSGRHKKGHRLNKAGSMGDECIDIRGHGDEFAIQPIRRSFSMDSSADRQLFLAVQEIVQQRRQGTEVPLVEGTSSGGGSRSRRNFFSFGRESRSSVLPLYFEPS